MPISWNEIRHNAIRFSHDWAGARSETAEKQTFWNEFFGVFGIRRRVVASFEEPVRTISGKYGFIDLFWPGMLLVEHKSLGADLGKAQSQAFGYIRDLVSAGRLDEVPRYVIVSDFARIALHDLEPEDQRSLPLLGNVKTIEFGLADLHKNIQALAFIPGYKQHRFEDQDPINLRAAGILADLHDALKSGGYAGHDLERFLVRVLFCLFAEDTGIFEREAFHLYIENLTKPDGSDLGPHLARLFEVLNTASEKRQTNLDETLAAFPYVNGDLFAEKLGFADFNRQMRDALLDCTRFNWSRISPAIFGSLFQDVMDPADRRQIGGHYTSERDILKVVRSLFLDDLREEFKRVRGNKAQLRRFHEKIGALRFLDPACGCGNFLVITYRELRLLEIEVLQALHGGERALDIQHFSLVDVDAFYGIEISEWPARIAEVAMWLMDHQMNLRLSEAFGEYYVRLPLRKSPTIVCGNALRLDWKSILPPDKCSYVLGNPPYVGKQYQTPAQRHDLVEVLSNFRNVGDVDYVVGWFKLAAQYIMGTRIMVGFVSTNSITQGEQVPLIWGELLDRYDLTIHFAHRSFKWESEAKGKAHVHVVIIGFADFPDGPKRLFDYDADAENPTESVVAFISPYLTPGPSVLVTKRQKPLCDVPEMRCGNKPSDGGNLILSDEEKKQLLEEEPEAAKYLRRFIGSEEFINGGVRWCLWLEDAGPAELRAMPRVMARVRAVKDFREKSTAEPTRNAAERPTSFFYVSQPKSHYIAIPEVSSERRRYIPIGFLSPAVIASNKLYMITSPSMYMFGVLSSTMHMAWMKQVAGRLENRYQYSGSMVYNNFPWPDQPSSAKLARVEEAAQRILDLRVQLGDGRSGFLPASKSPKKAVCLADLYTEAMPLPLYKAHRALDIAVDRCYRRQPFDNDRQRVEFLFALYEKLTAPLIPPARKRRRRE